MLGTSAAAQISFVDWTGGRTVSNIGTNAGSIALPFQDWRRFKEAFAPELVERALTETSGTVRHLVDPFGGSGTAALAAQFLGVKPTTIEVNPYLADLIEAKLAVIDLNKATLALRDIVEQVGNSPGPTRPKFKGAPPTFVEPGQYGRYIYSKKVARRLLAYRSAIEQVADAACKRLFRVMLASTAIPVSNVVVSGKGRRYRQGWETRATSPDAVDELFQSSVLQALYDLRRFSNRRCGDYTLLRGDARVLAANVGFHDLAVFSPPYPNSFDYTDVYNVELWTMGYLESREANTLLRNATLRSHVQILRNFENIGIKSRELDNTMRALSEVTSALWNRHIPQMIGAYAHDMATVIRDLGSNMRRKGRVYMVVGDSRYAGVDVPVASILGEIVPTLGFDVARFEPCRSMRSSPQQGGQHELPETLLVLIRR